MDLVYSLLIPQDGSLVSVSTTLQDTATSDGSHGTLLTSMERFLSPKTLPRPKHGHDSSVQGSLIPDGSYDDLSDALMLDRGLENFEEYEEAHTQAAMRPQSHHEHDQQCFETTLDPQTGHSLDWNGSKCSLSLVHPNCNTREVSLAGGLTPSSDGFHNSGIVQRFYRECHEQGVTPFFQFSTSTSGKTIAEVHIGLSCFTLDSPRDSERQAHDAVCEKAFDEVHLWYRDSSAAEMETVLSHEHMPPLATGELDEDWVTLVYHYTQKSRQGAPNFDILRTTQMPSAFCCRLTIEEYRNIPFDSTLNPTEKRAKAESAKIAIQWLRKSGKALEHRYLKTEPKPMEVLLKEVKVRVKALTAALGLCQPRIDVQKKKKWKITFAAYFNLHDVVKQPRLRGPIGQITVARDAQNGKLDCYRRVHNILKQMLKANSKSHSVKRRTEL